MQKNKFKMHVKDFLLFRKCTDEIEVITKEVSKVISGKKVDDFLDIGCGAGELTVKIAEKFNIKRTIAIDKESLSKNLRKEIVFFKKDWLNFDHPEKFDFILSAHSMAYLSFKKSKIAVEKIYDSLKKNGVAVIIIYDNTGNWPAFKELFYPKNKLKICTLDYLKPIFEEYSCNEKVFFTKIYAKDLDNMIKIGRFLGEKHIVSYSKNINKVSDFFKKFQQNKKGIIFPLEHRLFILHKRGIV